MSKRGFVSLGAMVLVSAVALTGCGEESGDPDADDGSQESTCSFEEGSDSVPQVVGEPGGAPEVEFESPCSVTETQVVVLDEGDGEVTEATDTLMVQYIGVNGSSGETFDSSYERGTPATFSLDMVVPGFTTGLSGQTVGSRVLIAVPPDQGYGPAGNPPAGIGPDDTLLFVVEILGIEPPPPTEAVCETPEGPGPAAGGAENLPEVTGELGEVPQVALQPPLSVTETQVRVIDPCQGGTIVSETDTLLAHIHGVNATTGEVFDSSYERGQPGMISVSGSIPGLMLGLTGQTVGSRVLIAVPPQDGLGPSGGNPAAGIGPDDTLLIVVEILAIQ